MSQNIFKKVAFFIPACVPDSQSNALQHSLETHGGVAATKLEEATHIITNSERFAGWNTVTEKQVVVTPQWVERSIIIVKQQAPSLYSVDPTKVFSGITACAAEDIPSNDVEVLSAGIAAHGGLWRTTLTVDVTHLFACSPTSKSYQIALAQQNATQIKIVLPHWFDECVRLNRGSVDVAKFEWPDPPYLSPSEDAKRWTKTDPLKKTLFRTINADSDAEFDPNTLPSKKIWKQGRFLLSQTLNFTPHRRAAFEASIKNADGIVLDPGLVGDEEEEMDQVEECDYFLTRYRSGKAYFQALRLNKTIGNLAWFFHVHATGNISRPEDELLHYPAPRKPIDGFSNHVITISNYTGECREYIKKLIDAMGAQFTANMSNSNTVLIAAHMGGAKTDKAVQWSIPVVNHFWLEDCFCRWRNLTTSVERYIYYPPQANFSVHLAERGVAKMVVDHSRIEQEEQEDAEYLASLNLKDGASLRRDSSPIADRSIVRGSLSPAKPIATTKVKTVERSNSKTSALSNGNKTTPIAGPSKRRASTKTVANEDDALMDIDNEPAPRAARRSSARAETSQNIETMEVDEPLKTATPKASVKPSRRGRESPEPIAIEEDETEERPKARVKGKGKPTLTGRNTHSQDTIDVDDRPRTPVARSKATKKAPSRNPTPIQIESDEDDDIDRELAMTDNIALLAKNPSRTGSKMSLAASTSQKTDGREDISIQKPKSTARRGRSAAKGSDSEDEGRSIAPKTRASSRPRKPTPKELSDEAPSESPVKRKPSARGRKSTTKELGAEDKQEQPPKRQPSTRRKSNAQEHEDEIEVISPPKRRASERTQNAKEQHEDEDMPPPAPKPPSRTHRRLEVALTPRSSLSKLSTAASSPAKPSKKTAVLPVAESRTSPPPEPAASTSSRPTRAASTKGTQKLHDLMEDRNQYDKEQKQAAQKAKRRGSGVHDTATNKRRVIEVESDDEEKSRAPKRQKLEKGKGKTKAIEISDDEGEAPAAKQPPVKRKSSSKPAAKGAGQVEVEDDTKSKPAPVIKVLTSQVSLKEPVIKALKQLGVRFTERPSDCTHLIVPHIVRTEKFLCAIAKAPYIVTEKWATDSVKAKRVLPAEDYKVVDPANEAKYNFNLDEVMAAAKQKSGNLFAGKTFVFTPSAPVAPVTRDLLKNVLQAHSGKMYTGKPTSAAMKDSTTRYLISCDTDETMCRDIMKTTGCKAYTHEFILLSALKQKLLVDEFELFDD